MSVSSSGVGREARRPPRPGRRVPSSHHDRKQHILTRRVAANVGSITEAVVAKDGEPFFICPPDGQLHRNVDHGYGFYHHDCRFLGGYELELAGERPTSLAAIEVDASTIVLELTNPDMTYRNQEIPREQLGITWSRAVEGSTPALEDALQIRNYGRAAAVFPLDLRFTARFEDIFEIRGLVRGRRGRLDPPAWSGDRLAFEYRGTDGVDRSIQISFDPPPARKRRDGVRFDLRVPGRGRTTIKVRGAIGEHLRPGSVAMERRESPPGKRSAVIVHRRRARDEHLLRMSGWPVSIQTRSLALRDTMERSLIDLQALRARLDGYRYYEAGVPWFATLFGRDALITAWQTLAYDPSIAGDTLRLLAGRQGRVLDDWRDEAPGKILHELRIGELARSGKIPHAPYYGTVDATPLFLILVGQHAAWTGRLDLFNELREPIDHALEWLQTYADGDGDGFVDYSSRTKHGLVNQGWKDSGDGIVTAAGEIARPPVALVEVQGYAFRAWLEIADLLDRNGEGDRAAALRRRARELRQRFEPRFWSAELGCYVLALADGERCEVVSSNAGHGLWTGIATQARARSVARSLMKRDMFNGWGIRTLSAEAAAFRPLGYHLGTVWPHDNALIAAGFRRYGLDVEAERIFAAMVEAALQFPHGRLPECFAGYDRTAYPTPVSYPVACHPQAWAAGSIPSLLASSLGLEPDGFARRLRVVRPRLPTFVETLELRGLAVADARIDLRFERRDKSTSVEVLGTRGNLDVAVDNDRALEPSDITVPRTVPR